MSIDDVHKFRGCHCSYVLKCEGEEEGFHVYVGSTSDVEARMAKHGRGQGAVATRTWPPTGELLHIREHETAREAMLAEVALWSLWAGKIGHQRVRGGRWNMGGQMPFPPREIRELERSLASLSVSPGTCPEFHEEDKEPDAAT